MGLLDQVLGQVLGRMGSPSGGSGMFPQGGGGGLGGGGAPGGFNLPGGLGNLPGGLGGLLSGKGGPIAMAILALLASKHLQNGAGGYGSILHDMFGGAQGGDSDRSMPQAQAPSGGMLGGGAPQAGGSGGFMDQIGGMLGGGNAQASQGGFGAPSGGSGPMGGALGGALGGGLGGVLGGGLNDLLERFSQNGRGGAMQSWIGHGPNEQISPDDLESSLGTDTVEDLSRQTGLPRGDLLSQLSQALPQVVDQLTPHGRLPQADETSRWI